MMMRHTQSGYIALISVLIIGAVSVAIATALLITGSDAQQENLARQQSMKARQAAAGCIDEALQQIHDNTAFVATNTAVTIGDATCTYTVTNTGTSTRTITATSTNVNVVRKIQTYVTINSSSLSISSWQEVQ
jgi:archaellum component FlaG (FlaF/FlaG flagellin family)